jgi:hypothetical protein
LREAVSEGSIKSNRNRGGMVEEVPGFSADRIVSLMRRLTRGSKYRTVNWGFFSDDRPPGQRSGILLKAVLTDDDVTKPITGHPDSYALTCCYLTCGVLSEARMVVTWKRSGELIQISRVFRETNPNDPNDVRIRSNRIQRLIPSEVRADVEEGIASIKAVLETVSLGQRCELLASSATPEGSLIRH